MNGTTITGYLYGDDTHCATCIHDLFVPFDLIADPDRSAEDILDQVAHQRGLNRHDQGLYSSYDFPVPLYLSDTSDSDVCVLCGQRLLDGLYSA
ncbi:hypothetical protein ACQPW3_34660 [Actinosynnema sp. CA-248983]